MDTRFSSITKTIQPSHSLSDAAIAEWKAIELMDDFVNNAFMLPSKVHSSGEQASVDENGVPKSFTQFIA